METQTHSQTTTCQCHFNLDYIRTIPGILKIVEFVLAVIAFACATSIPYGWCGLGWVSFVGISGFVGALISFFFHLLITWTWAWSLLIELIWYAIWTIFFLIAGIVAAADANCDYIRAFSYTNTAGAAAAFSFFSMVAWAVDSAFQAQGLRISWTSSSATATTTTTTTTTKATTSERFEGNPQY